MNINGLIDRISDLKKIMADLPQGEIIYNNDKNIYEYVVIEKQEVLNKAVSLKEMHMIQEQINKRESIKSEINKLNKLLKDQDTDIHKFELNVYTRDSLKRYASQAENFKKRDCFYTLTDYLYGKRNHRVCCLTGLRRTGKTTMIQQALLNMDKKDLQKSAFIDIEDGDEWDSLILDLKKLQRENFKFVFIDEITLLDEFIDHAAILSDIYAMMGMKIVLSGTDSLGFYLAKCDSLYDRTRIIHTSFIPFREYSKIMNIDDVDKYIEFGGTLSDDEILFDEGHYNVDVLPFYDKFSTEKYIDNAISQNILHSLECYKNGGRFRELYPFYKNGTLENIINRIVEDENHLFAANKLLKKFKSRNLGSAKDLMSKKEELEEGQYLLYDIDSELVTKKLMDYIHILNQNRKEMNIDNNILSLIELYLKEVGALDYVNVKYIDKVFSEDKNIIITQPGMRYCQARSLVKSIITDDVFKTSDDNIKNIIFETILNDVKGHILEEMIVYDTMRSMGRDKEVFKLKFQRGEFDMVVYDNKTSSCEIYEIKHSHKYFPEKQTQWIMNEDYREQTENRFGFINKTCVIYMGHSFVDENGIKYKNAGEYLLELKSDREQEKEPIDSQIHNAREKQKNMNRLEPSHKEEDVER